MKEQEQRTNSQNGQRHTPSQRPQGQRPARPQGQARSQNTGSQRPPQSRAPQQKNGPQRDPQRRTSEPRTGQQRPPQGRGPQPRSGPQRPPQNRPARPPRPERPRSVPREENQYDGIQLADGSFYYTGDMEIAPTRDEYRHPEKKKRKMTTGKKVLFSVLGVLAVVLVAVFIIINVLIGQIHYEPAVEDVYQPNTNTAAASEARDIPLSSSPDVTNILLLGSDSEGSEQGGRSDTNLLLSIDRKHGKIKLTSFLRDLYVEIPEYRASRINAAFNHGGPDRVIQTIEANFRVKIDAYFRLDFSSMSELVNSVGGIECELTQKEADYITNKTGVKTSAGVSRLYGFQSLWYCRIRKLDSDFGRTSRQRNFINFMLADFKSRSLTEQYSFMHEMLPHLITREDTRGKMWWFLICGVMALNYETEELMIPIEGGYSSQSINGASVLVPNIEKSCAAIKEFIYPD